MLSFMQPKLGVELQQSGNCGVKLDSFIQPSLTLSSSIESVKCDVIKRGVKPQSSIRASVML